MRRLALALALVPAPLAAQDLAQPGTVPFTQTVLVDELAAPWEITWGPDDRLWITERAAGRIIRVDPDSGAITVAAAIDEVVGPGWQDGLLGMALHPGLLGGTGHDHVFAAYTYADPARPADPSVADPASPYAHLFAKIVRLTFDAATGTLGDPVTLIDGLPAGTDHNSGRLKIGPDGMLYYTIGDMGHDQLANWCLPIEAQRLPTASEVAAGDWGSYVGKSLRLTQDGAIPPDNPVLDGVQSHVFTYGHRNMQGLAFGPDGTLYGAEHGPKTDDEVNILWSGGNYGWPHVAGFRDNSAYQYARWADAATPCASLTFSDITIDPSVPVADETAWTQPMQDPLATLFTVPGDWNFEDPACEGVDYICWPTVAPSSIEVYRPADPIPGFGNALLVTTLKRGSLYRIALTEDGLAAAGPAERYFRTDNRYRDLAISPDGRRIFIVTDIGGQHDSATGGVMDGVANPGAILVFTAAP